MFILSESISVQNLSSLTLKTKELWKGGGKHPPPPQCYNETKKPSAYRVNDENEEFFSELEQGIATLACENKSKTAKLKPSDLELIKTTSNGKYKNVYPRIYTSGSGRVACKLSERKKVKGVFKRRKLKIGDLVDESFKRYCVIKVYQVYISSSKTITLSVEEIVATELHTKRS